MKKTFTLLFTSLFLSLFFVFFLIHITTAEAASATSNCVITNIGNPSNDYKLPDTLPPECLGNAPIDDSLCKPASDPLAPPPNHVGEYCQMPNRPSDSVVPDGLKNGLYTFSAGYHLNDWKKLGPQIWGSRELIQMIYTAAQWWKYGHTFANGVVSPPHPNGYVIVRDMASSYHISHKWGTTVDIEARTGETEGKYCVSNYASHGCSTDNYNRQATVLFGMIFVDTGYLHTILHDGDTIAAVDPKTGQNSTVNKAISDYARFKYPNKYKSYPPVQRADRGPSDNHHDHFHVYIDRKKDIDYKPGTHDFDLEVCTKITGVGCKY